MDLRWSVSSDVLRYPVRGARSRRRFAVGVLPFAFVWFAMAWVAMLPPEGQQIPLVPPDVLGIVSRGLTVPMLVLPGYLVLLGYYARVLDETLDGARDLAGFGAPLALARTTALTALSLAVFLPVGIALAYGLVWVVSVPMTHSPSSLPESIGLTALVLGLVVVVHAALAQLVALFVADGRLRALLDVRRTLSLVGRPALLVASLRLGVLVFAGGLLGYSLYVAVIGLGSIGGPHYGLWGGLLLPMLAAAVLGASVHYTTLCAFRAFALVAHSVVENAS